MTHLTAVAAACVRVSWARTGSRLHQAAVAAAGQALGWARRGRAPGSVAAAHATLALAWSGADDHGRAEGGLLTATAIDRIRLEHVPETVLCRGGDDGATVGAGRSVAGRRRPG